jgi:uncharacterized membrane protein YfcA
MSDVAVILSYRGDDAGAADWAIIKRLFLPTAVGLGVGMQLLGKISKAEAKLLIGTILLGILLLNAFQALSARRRAQKANALTQAAKKNDENGKPEIQLPAPVPAYAHSVAFACLIGLTGGFATILTNSMGPMLNVFFLTLQVP